ncbi:hypothetical protein [Microseira wollei]|uniref:hypothetical protein n=1 Tax=Microseira wollei TaxID=467598 RepID=UPI001CFF1DCD|nr:hypothetical protein [Microseira wollei]
MALPIHRELPPEPEFSWSYIPSKGRSPGSQDPYFFLQPVPISLVFADGIEGQDVSNIPYNLKRYLNSSILPLRDCFLKFY